MKYLQPIGLLSLLLLLYALPLQAVSKADDEKKIAFDFRQADIKTIVGFMAKLSNLTVIMDDKVRGRVTVSSPEKLTIDEAYKVFMAVLDIRGFSVIKTDKFLKIVHKKEALQKPVDIHYGASPEEVPDVDAVITQIIPIKNTTANKVLANIRSLISGSGSAFAHDTSNSLVLTETGSNIRRLTKLISHLDVVRQKKQQSEMRVFHIRYLKAAEIGEALGKMFTNNPSAEPGSQVEIKMSPIETVNSLIVTADRNLLPQIQATIEAIDIRSRQVLIEVHIVEFTLNNNFNFGVRLEEYLNNKGGTKHTVTAGLGVPNNIFSYSIERDKLKTMLQMLSQDSRIKILSKPRLVTSDNKKAKILVGQEQPILKSVTDVDSSAGKTVSDFVYKDVGIEMEVTPRINIDRDVTLELGFKITSILSETTFPGGVTAPVVGKREASTHVTVMDRNTLVIGGLIKNDERENKSSVPGISKIPLIGKLFTNTGKVKEETELLLFITPQVINSEKEGRGVTSQELKILDDEFDTQNIIKKRPRTRRKKVYHEEKVLEEDKVLELRKKVRESRRRRNQKLREAKSWEK